MHSSSNPKNAAIEHVLFSQRINKFARNTLQRSCGQIWLRMKVTLHCSRFLRLTVFRTFTKSIDNENSPVQTGDSCGIAKGL